MQSAVEKEFRVQVTADTVTQFSNIFLKPLFSKTSRTDFYNFITSDNIFPVRNIYRPNDITFGLQKEMKMLLQHGIETVAISKYVPGLVNNFARKTFKFGKVKSAEAKQDNKVIYEVIYVELFDDLENSNGSVSDKVAQGRADLQAKADLVAPGGTGEGIVVRGNIPITDPGQIEEFNRLFPGTDAMSPEAKEWLTTNVDGAAEKFDQAAASRPKPTAQQLSNRGKSMAFQSGHSTNTNVLSEDQVTKLFVAVAYKQNLMEAPGMLSNLKKQIGKGVTKLGQKARQVGTNITTKVTADKLMKAWNKAGKSTDSVQVAQWLTTQGVDGAVMQQAFQTAGIKMPDLKKIATDDPVMALTQKINSNPAIKKQVMQYLNAVT